MSKDDGIPELIAFWQYLKREYALRQANASIKRLKSIELDFARILNWIQGRWRVSQNLKIFVIYVLYVLMVILVSLLPSSGGSFWHIDKIGHFLAYAGMAMLALLVFKSRISRVAALCFAVALGAALEWGQSFVPGRDMSLLDGIANTLGVMTGTVLFWFRGQVITRYVARFFGE